MANYQRIQQIGKLGENFFERLCIDSCLNFSSPRYDENGWDSFIEFPLNSLLNMHRDSQPAPMKCLVQVKSTDNDIRSSIDMTLSNWEKLALSINPSFVIIFYFDDKSEAPAMFLCHFNDERIRKTLAKIRDLEKADALDSINHRRMMFVPEWHEKLDAKASNALRQKILLDIGCDFGAYAERKAQVLRHIGFDQRPYTVKFTTTGPIGGLIDAFLGLKEFDIQDVHLGSRRFGIELVDRQFAIGKLRITPQTSGSCKISASSRQQGSNVTIDGHVFTPAIPGLSPSEFKLLIRSGDITIELSQHSGTFSAELSGEKLRSLEQAILDTKLLHIMQTQDAKTTITTSSGTMPLEFSVRPRPERFFSLFTQG